MEEKLKIKKYDKTKTKELGTSVKGLNCTMLIASHQLVWSFTVQIIRFSDSDYATSGTAPRR